EGCVGGMDDEASAPAVAESDLAALLGDEHAVEVGRLEAADDRVLGGSVDRRRLVAALAGPDDGLAVGSSRELREREAYVVDRSTTERGPVSQGDGRATLTSASGRSTCSSAA